jgi:hypothetical protein
MKHLYQGDSVLTIVQYWNDSTWQTKIFVEAQQLVQATLFNCNILGCKKNGGK